MQMYDLLLILLYKICYLEEAINSEQPKLVIGR